ncbi:MAG TPA: M20/M25/M40 family metallo-hydrolase [Acidimicrobiales bacterium]
MLVDRDAVAARLAEAIGFRTISNQDRDDFDEKAFDDFHAWLQVSFPLVHQHLEREVLGEPRAFSLLYTWKGKDPLLAPVVLLAHQDVVPVVPGTEQQWEHDPFSGDIADGYIWGRGSLDDKNMVLAILEAVEMQLAAAFQPTRTIILVFGQDEEVMGLEGVRHIVEVLQARGVHEVALVLDEGLPLTVGLFPGVTAPMALIGTAEKGYTSLELKVSGPGGHSAMPPKNSNIGILAQAITRLEANPFPYRVTQTVRDQMRFLGPELPEGAQSVLVDIAYGDDEQAADHDPHRHDEHGHTNCPTAGWHHIADSREQFTKYMLSGPQTTAMMHTTTAVTMVSGGVKENVLPPLATAVVNFRILQGDTVDSVIEYVKSVVNDDRVHISALSSSIDPSPISDPYGDEYKMIETTIRQTWDLPDLIVSPYLVIGGADAKYFASTIAKNVYRFTAVRVESAADAARWHGVNERVLVDEHANSVRFFHNLIANIETL